MKKQKNFFISQFHSYVVETLRFQTEKRNFVEIGAMQPPQTLLSFAFVYI